jgi:diguanylate cyclase (GGDEF)-like protein/PAS domain S-box-containing protein
MTPKKKSAEKSNIAKPKKHEENAGRQNSDFPIAGIDAAAGGFGALHESEDLNRLLQGILRSSSDGILAVNRENEVLFANERFVDMWRVPLELLARKDDALLLQYVLDQLSDPQGFLHKVQELYNSAAESLDTLYFKDGRVFDRLSRPLLQGTEVRGRVWSFRDITERKRAEEALRESEERYHSLFDGMMDGVYRSTHEGKFLDVNPAMVRMFGYSSREEMLEVDIKNELYFAPEERGSHVLDTGREEMDVYRMRRKDGSEIWVEDHGYYVHDEQGQIIYHEGMLRDITGRKRIEDALAASEVELRALFASMHDVVLVIDRQGVYRKIAPTNPGLLVKPPEELLGKNLKDVFPPKEAEAFRLAVQQALDAKQNTQIEYELVIGGRSMWFHTTISPLNADSTLWVAHEITNRKQAEEALRTAEANYRSIFENATVGIYQSTPQGRFLSVNPLMARLFGFDSPEEMLNSIASIEKQYYVDPADRREFQRLMMEQGEVREFISLNRRKDGGSIWVQENARAVKDADGNILHYEGFITDITERRQAEEVLNHTKNELTAINLKLQHSLEREEQLACTDGLTGLYNHRHFFELADREFHAAVRHKRPLTFLMFDMDDFKQVNDSLGHTAGDKLLVIVAQTAMAQVRASDLVARYGGDEFIILLPQASAEQALPVAERIRSSIAALRVETAGEPFAVTLSIGIAEMRHEPVDENLERVIQRADDAMYKAKQSGRNRTVLFGQDEIGSIG